jgi:hypothetical protein
MPRYYKTYFNADPMKELSQADAHADGWYIEEVEGPPAHFRKFEEGKLAAVLYPGQVAPAAFAPYHEQNYRGTPREVYSPIKTEPARQAKSWTVWYFDREGALQRTLAYEYDIATPNWRSQSFNERGEPMYRMEHLHNAAGEPREIVTYDSSGKEINREDVD